MPLYDETGREIIEDDVTDEPTTWDESELNQPPRDSIGSDYYQDAQQGPTGTSTAGGLDDLQGEVTGALADAQAQLVGVNPRNSGLRQRFQQAVQKARTRERALRLLESGGRWAKAKRWSIAAATAGGGTVAGGIYAYFKPPDANTLEALKKNRDAAQLHADDAKSRYEEELVRARNEGTKLQHQAVSRAWLELAAAKNQLYADTVRAEMAARADSEHKCRIANCSSHDQENCGNLIDEVATFCSNEINDLALRVDGAGSQGQYPGSPFGAGINLAATANNPEQADHNTLISCANPDYGDDVCPGNTVCRTRVDSSGQVVTDDRGLPEKYCEPVSFSNTPFTARLGSDKTKFALENCANLWGANMINSRSIPRASTVNAWLDSDTNILYDNLCDNHCEAPLLQNNPYACEYLSGELYDKGNYCAFVPGTQNGRCTSVAPVDAVNYNSLCELPQSQSNSGCFVAGLQPDGPKCTWANGECTGYGTCAQFKDQRTCVANPMTTCQWTADDNRCVDACNSPELMAIGSAGALCDASSNCAFSGTEEQRLNVFPLANNAIPEPVTGIDGSVVQQSCTPICNVPVYTTPGTPEGASCNAVAGCNWDAVNMRCL